MADGMMRNMLTTVGCLSMAIQMSGRTMAEILVDIVKEKKLENEVMQLYECGWKHQRIANHLKIRPGKALHIIKFDLKGLSYRKVGQKNIIKRQ